MRKSKLLDVLKTFSPLEWRHFESFLNSPYFNRDPGMLALAKLLRKEAPAFREDRINRLRLWKLVFPKREPHVKDIKYWMNGLLKLAEQFLGQQLYEGREVLGGLHVLEACATRNLEKNFRNRSKKIQKQLESTRSGNQFYHFDQYLMAGIEVEYLRRQQLRTHDERLQDLVNHLDEFYLISKLRLTCELVNRQHILSGSYDIRLVDAMKINLQTFQYDRIPAIAIYLEIFSILTETDPAPHFQRLQKLISEHFELFPQSEKVEIYSYAQNFCIRMIRKGHADYTKRLFQLYIEGLKAGIFIEEGRLSPWKFKNIVSAGLRLGKYEWVKGFIDEYHEMLPEEFEETALLYNQANLQYHLGDHSQAMRLLNQVEFSDVFYSLDTRVMMAKIFYERTDTEALISLISSFRAFLRRNKLISEANRRSYSNFVTAVNHLLRMDEGKMAANDVETEFKGMKSLVEKEWLLQKAQVRD